MWKSRPDEKPASPTPQTQTAMTPPSAAPVLSKDPRAPESNKTSEPFRSEVAAHIGKSVLIKGELSGSEDLYLDGEVEGLIELRDHSLVIGPNSRIRANISAREVIVHGRVEGNVIGTERVELKQSCVLSGDITTQRVVIQDGAFFKGSVDLQRESKAEVRKPVAAAAAASSSSAPSLAPQTSLLEHK